MSLLRPEGSAGLPDMSPIARTGMSTMDETRRLVAVGGKFCSRKSATARDAALEA